MEHMTWADCVAALGADLQPVALLPISLDAGFNDLGTPVTAPISHLYQKLHDNGATRSFQLVYLRPPLPFWEYMDGWGSAASARSSSFAFDEELTVDVAELFRPLFVDNVEMVWDQDLPSGSSPHRKTPRDAKLAQCPRSESNDDREVIADNSARPKRAFDLDEGVQALQDLASFDASSEHATSASCICNSFSLYQWSVVFQTVREREMPILQDTMTSIRIAEIVHTSALGEWMLFGLAENVRRALEWPDVARKATEANDTVRIANAASQCLNSWTYASLKRRLKRDSVFGDISTAAIASFIACRSLEDH